MSGTPTSSGDPWPRVALHLAVVAALVAAVELAFAAAGPARSPFERGERFYPTTRVPNVEESTIQWQLERMRREPADIAILGDSSAMMGLEPAVFARETGLGVQNYATVSWLHTEGHADILDLYLALHGPPTAVVYQMGTLIHVYPHAELMRGGLLANFRTWIGVGTDRWPIPLPSLPYRGAARDLIEGDSYPARYTSAPRGREPSDDEVREWLERHAGMNVDRAPRADWDSLPPLRATWEPTVETGLLRIFRAAEQHGFTVFVLHNPIPDRFRSPERDAEYAAIEDRVVALAEPFDRVSVVGPFARYMPTEAFANFEHLTPQGGRANSFQVAPIIARQLGVGPTAAPAPEGATIQEVDRGGRP